MSEQVLDQLTLDHNLRAILGVAPSVELRAPENRIVFDLETTSPRPAEGHIWQFGYYLVRNGGPVYSSGCNIYLRQPVDVLFKEGRWEINRRAAAMAHAAGCSPDEPLPETCIRDAEEQFIGEIHKHGIPPDEALATIAKTLETFASAGFTLVGQNCIRFDIPFLEFEWQRMGIPTRFQTDGIIDTGILIKASRLMLRKLGKETVREFYIRVSELKRKGCYYSIERFCVPYFRLDTRFGIDVTKLHSAAEDCKVTDIILQCLLDEARSVFLKF